MLKDYENNNMNSFYYNFALLELFLKDKYKYILN